MPEAKRQQELGEKVSCRERKGHKREEKDCKDGENGKEDSARRKQSVREILKSTEHKTILRYKKASEGRGRGPTAVDSHVLFMQVQMIMYHFKLKKFKCQ